ncbi:MAG: hypothetical protein HZA31_03615 [Opitutae bacterium]|nr:hypothetical protein [Opitutae bacterium]
MPFYPSALRCACRSILTLLIAGLLLAGICNHAHAQSPMLFMFLGLTGYQQNSATTFSSSSPTVAIGQAYYMSSMRGATVDLRTPLGQRFYFQPYEDDLFMYMNSSSSFANFEARFPIGTYTLTTTNASGHSATLDFTIASRAAIQPIRITNYDELQNVATAAVTIRWPAISGANADDYFSFDIESATGATLYEAPDSLTALATEITVPNLPRNQQLWGTISYAKTQYTTNSLSNYIATGYGVTTRFPIKLAPLDTTPAFRLTTQPLSQTVARGASTDFSVSAVGTGLTYQWSFNGVATLGATKSSYTIPSASLAQAGRYSVTVRNSSGASLTSQTATLTVVDKAEPGQLMNLSVRTNAGTGSNSLIVGFVTGGADTAGKTPLLIRVSGPALTDFGVPGALPDPKLSVVNNGTTIASNDDWGSGGAALLATCKSVGAFDFPTGSKDAATTGDFSGNVYSIMVNDGQGRSGTALAEIYDASKTAGVPRLINVSARAQVTADNPLIAGFVIDRGATSRTVLIRGIGPTLRNFGVTDALTDTRITLYRGDTAVYENDDWGTASNAAQVTATSTQVGAFTLSPTTKDAVLLVSLPPGSYSAQVSGTGSATGVALVEIYEVP